MNHIVFLPEDGLHQIKETDYDDLDAPITKEELRATVMSMKKNKAPGLDGLPADFYQLFYPDLEDVLFDSISYSFTMGFLSNSQKRTVIKLIPKKNKIPHYVQNFRPISLIGVDVKIIARLLALRLKGIAKEILSKDQKAFISGRNIGENVLDIYSIIAAAEDNQEDNILVFLDIQKAYDTVKWRFISTILAKLGFPLSFIRWFEILQKDNEVRIYNNGHSSGPIKTSKGLAQGSGLSPLLFIIAMDRLSNVINKNTNIVGVQHNGVVKKVDMAADDTVVCMTGTEANLRELSKVLEKFYLVSGLKVNFEKSVIMKIGPWSNSPGILYCNQPFKWNQEYHYLGIDVRADGTWPHLEQSFQLDNIQQKVFGLRYCYYSLIGRILILKTLISSTFVYKFSLYPKPPIQAIQNLNKLFYDYVWNDHRHKLNQRRMEQPPERGGFNMVNVALHQWCLSLRWIKQTLNNQDTWNFWECYLRDSIKIDLRDFLRCNISKVSYKNLVKNWKSFPDFWKGILDTWFSRRWLPMKTQNTDAVWSRGFLFNGYFGDIYYNNSLKCYEYFRGMNIFTVEEFSLCWEFFADDEKTELLKCYPRLKQKRICEFIQKKPEESADLFVSLVKGSATTKSLYANCILENCTFPDKVVRRWEQDLDIPLTEIWYNICLKSNNLVSTKMKTFHILFLNRAFFLNNVTAKFTQQSSDCSFCKSELDSYVHAFWDCRVTQTVWTAIIDFCNEYIVVRQDKMSKPNCLMSNFSSSLLVLVTVAVKKYIHLCKIYARMPLPSLMFAYLKKIKNDDWKRSAYCHKIDNWERFWRDIMDDEIFDINIDEEEQEEPHN